VSHFFLPTRCFTKNKKMFSTLRDTILFRISAIFSFANLFRLLSEMVFSGKRYYNIYRIMLTAIGLWPYQTPIITQMLSVFFLSAYCFILLFQVFIDPFFYTMFSLMIPYYINLVYCYHMYCSLRPF